MALLTTHPSIGLSIQLSIITFLSESLSRHPSNHPTDPSSKNLIVTLNAENEISIKSETCYEKYHHEKKIKKENEIPKSNQNDCATFTKNVFTPAYHKL